MFCLFFWIVWYFNLRWRCVSAVYVWHELQWFIFIRRTAFFRYDLAWVCDSPYIYIGTENNHPNDAYIGINGEIKHTDVGWANDGSDIYLYETGTKYFNKDLVWVAECKMVTEKLYLTVIVWAEISLLGFWFLLYLYQYMPGHVRSRRKIPPVKKAFPKFILAAVLHT